MVNSPDIRNHNEQSRSGVSPDVPSAPFTDTKMGILTYSEEETEKIGEQMGKKLRPGDMVALVGELGSGKTCLIRGICKGLGVMDMVSSPTFIIVHQYRGRVPVYHTDFYRIREGEGLEDIGLGEILSGDGVVLLEWADRAPEIVPPDAITVNLSIIDERTRQLEINDRRDQSDREGSGSPS